MIGKKVPKEMVDAILEEEKRKDGLVKELKEELKALKPGECLVYETRAGMETALSLSLSLSVKKLKLIVRPGKVYAYKEE